MIFSPVILSINAANRNRDINTAVFEIVWIKQNIGLIIVELSFYRGEKVGNCKLNVAVSLI